MAFAALRLIFVVVLVIHDLLEKSKFFFFWEEMSSNNSEREGAVLDKLVSISSRMFYESKFVVFLDAMIKLQ